MLVQIRYHGIRALQVLVVVAIMRAISSVHVPGCGDLEDMRWNSTCLISSAQYFKSAIHKVLVLHNVLMYDGTLYYIVPHKSDQDWVKDLRGKFEKFMNGEVEFEVSSVSESPLVFGKSSVANNQFTIETVKEINYSLLIQSVNLKTKVLEQIQNLTLQYVPSAHVSTILCKVLEQCTVDDRTRSSTLFINTVRNQSIMDFDNGVKLHCFSDHGLFPLGMSTRLNSTLFILRKVAVFSPIDKREPVHANVSLNTEIQDQCIAQGYAYDPSGLIQRNKRYDVSVCAIFKNEGRHLLEWISYHNLIGIQHFYLFNDYSTDEGLEILSPLVKRQLVTVLNRSDYYVLESEFNPQLAFLKYCGEKFSNTSRWILSIDLDEYLVVKGENYNNNLINWLQEHPILRTETGAVEIPRDSFAGNYYLVNHTQLLIGELVHKKLPDPLDHDLRTLVNTNGLAYLFMHWGYTYKPIRNGLLQEQCFIRGVNDSDCTPSESALMIQHYVVKNFESCSRKANPKLWRNSWRGAKGLEYCQEMIFGYKNKPDEWFEDHTLANEGMIKKVCERMRELNQKWYDSRNACGDYSYVQNTTKL
eukprot:TRINITY_DN625_c1_g1_i1.p1 TRINITY_DN625_c1_g1~~TRINITY_DN625_c1_g1_i1.p1  ORF type:complete len:586 (+),score=24.89 TRINITY_DN625_c1_g1_i1:170-1927(+)